MSTQQEFLRAAMVELGGLTREAFSKRLGCAQRTLDKWLLPSESKDHRSMDETIWNLVREILAHEKLKAAHRMIEKNNSTLVYTPIYLDPRNRSAFFRSVGIDDSVEASSTLRRAFDAMKHANS